MTKNDQYPGVNPKWLRRRKNWFQGIKSWHDEHLPYLIEGFEQYVEHGYAKWDKNHGTVYGRWMGIDSQLFQYADQLALELIVKGTGGEAPCFDRDLAAQAYAAHYLAKSIQRSYDDEGYPPDFTVFGVCIGCGEPALEGARRLIRSRRDYYCDVEGRRHPLTVWMFALLADYLGEPFDPLGPMREDRTLVRLREHWRDSDPKAIEADCLTLCDDHTYTTAFESNHWFDYMPIEILLLFRLRQMLGLENPCLDHPLMNTPLGQLPEPISLQYDDLCSRVRARMIREGFDETLASGNDEWCALRKESLSWMSSFLFQRTDLGTAVAIEHQALALAERESNHRRLYDNLLTLGIMYRVQDKKAEAVPYYERALRLAEPDTARGPDLILRDLVPTLHDLGRAADAEALCRQYAYTWPEVPHSSHLPARPPFIWPNEISETRKRKPTTDAAEASEAPPKKSPPTPASKSSEEPARAETQKRPQSTAPENIAPIGKTKGKPDLKAIEDSVRIFLIAKPAQIFTHADEQTSALSVGLLAQTDAERDKLKADRLLQTRLGSVGAKVTGTTGWAFSIVIESRETIDRDHNGIWLSFIDE